VANDGFEDGPSTKVLRLNAVQSEIGDWLVDRERRKVTEMVLKFRAKEAPTYADLLACAAAISEIRYMKSDIDKRISQEVTSA